MSKSAPVCRRIIAAMHAAPTLGVPAALPGRAPPLDTDMIVLGIVLGIVGVGAWLALRMHREAQDRA